MEHLELIESDRYGGHYDSPNNKRAINAHSERTYQDTDGNLYRLSRNLDEVGRSFQASGPYAKDFVGILPRFEVDGQVAFAEGRSWQTAERMLDEAVGEYRLSLSAPRP